MTDIYGNMLPGWPVSANNTDEGMNGPTNMSQFARGQITIDNYTTNWGYGNIDRINFFLDQLEGVTVLTDVEKSRCVVKLFLESLGLLGKSFLRWRCSFDYPFSRCDQCGKSVCTA